MLRSILRRAEDPVAANTGWDLRPYRLNVERPEKTAFEPSSSSMRMSWLYFSTLSPRQGAPVLIWPVPMATLRSAMKLSTVSPLRWEIMAVQPALRAISIAATVSVRVPIWLSLIRIELADFSAMPRARRLTLVTKRSSPTSWMRPPSVRWRRAQPSQSSSARPSSMETIG